MYQGSLLGHGESLRGLRRPLSPQLAKVRFVSPFMQECLEECFLLSAAFQVTWAQIGLKVGVHPL